MKFLANSWIMPLPETILAGNLYISACNMAMITMNFYKTCK